MTKVFSFFIGILLLANPVFSESNFKRPQEPQRPFPYDEEEVVFENASANVRLAGTLTLPRTEGPVPVVVLVQGHGPLDRDSSLFGHKPFFVWADHLTRQGIAVLRFDKRSTGTSTGDYTTATVEDFASDALTAVEYLKTRKEVDQKKIGLIGHSEGGMVVSFAASQSKDIAFIVMMAAPCVTWEDLLLDQETAMQRIAGVSQEIIGKNRQLRKLMCSVIKKENNPQVVKEKLRELFTTYLNNATEPQKTALETCYGPVDGQIQFFNLASIRYNFINDPAIYLKKVKIPVLALNGEMDFIVSVEQNLNRIEKVLAEAGHKDFTIVKLPKLNHAFQTCRTGAMMECAEIEETAAPAVLNLMSDWILQRTVKKN